MKDDLTIPKFLRRGPITAEQREKLDELTKSVVTPTLTLRTSGEVSDDLLKPKGMTMEEWKEVKAKRKSSRAMTDEVKEKLKAKKQAGKPAKVSRDGLVSIGAIAKEMGLIAGEARGILRAIKMAKPACGWAWVAGDVAKIKEAITAGRGTKAAVGKKATSGKVIPLAGEDTGWALSKKERSRWKKESKVRSEKEMTVAIAADEAAEAVKSKAATARKGKANEGKTGSKKK